MTIRTDIMTGTKYHQIDGVDGRRYILLEETPVLVVSYDTPNSVDEVEEAQEERHGLVLGLEQTFLDSDTVQYWVPHPSRDDRWVQVWQDDESLEDIYRDVSNMHMMGIDRECIIGYPLREVYLDRNTLKLVRYASNA